MLIRERIILIQLQECFSNHVSSKSQDSFCVRSYSLFWDFDRESFRFGLFESQRPAEFDSSTTNMQITMDCKYRNINGVLQNSMGFIPKWETGMKNVKLIDVLLIEYVLYTYLYFYRYALW